jgi:hypothetical protein
VNEGYKDRLMTWHTAHPDDGFVFDHLTDRDPGIRSPERSAGSSPSR